MPRTVAMVDAHQVIWGRESLAAGSVTPALRRNAAPYICAPGCQRVMEGSNGQLGLGAWWPATALNGAQTVQRIDDGHKHERPHPRGRALQL